MVELSGKNSQLIIKTGDAPEIMYWGKKLRHYSDDYNVTLSRPVPYGRLDADVPLTLSPELGRGVFSSPGIEGHRHGHHWAPVFITQGVVHGDGQLTIASTDELAGLALNTELTIDENDVVRIRHTLKNTGDTHYQVNRLACTLPLPARAAELMTFYGRWLHEFQTDRQSLRQGGYQQENRRGRTSHEHYPALVVGTPAFNELQGEVWGFHFAWSGNHRMRVDVKADGRRFLQAEVIYFPGEMSLAPGESLTTPWLYATYSASGLNTMSHQFHEHVRHTILDREFAATPRKIHLNTWEGIYFAHNPEYIMSMATEAAKMGVERFIIDDGWFKGRHDDTAALGDWFLDDEKYPDGIKPVISHVKQLGMEFGLWFEPEMINKDSDLYRHHPDWLLAVPGYDQPTGRHQYVIDLQNPEAFHYLYNRLEHFLSEYEIDYIKWDMNREIVQPAHQSVASGYKQTQCFYQLLDKVKARFPQLEIESCAAGGGRIDYEVLKRTQRFWTSDNNDALERQAIQRGMSYFFPPEVMGCHIGAAHCHSTRRQHSIEFRGITALFGHMGIELDPVSVSDDERNGFARYIKLHKTLRPVLHSGDTLRLPTDDDAHLAHAVISKDKSDAIVMIAQLTMPTHALSGHLKIPGLKQDALYTISVIDAPANLEGIVNYQPPWIHSDCPVSGEWLQESGLSMPLLDPETALLIHIRIAG
ncbi:alpha-galactosidase [Vibrio salinus]|uniref:alpha-galactosidase n=1 Tax=Vibrio salinus TaxID=2899784 RepID=UPI001E580BE6|nr:alpha-galactosidase [Vibrio salinus]MCE0495680.1 alpha-galactosidase [Vibrio salinus]